MIFLQVISGILAFVLTPVVLIIFFIQSKHFFYQAGTTLLLIAYSFCLMFSYGNVYMSIYVFLILFILQQIVYVLRWQNINFKRKVKYVFGQVITRKKKISFDFIISLLPFYFIKNLTFSMVIRSKERNMEIRLKETIRLILEYGAGTSVDINIKDTNIRFRMV
jgi:hypothetical protein